MSKITELRRILSKESMQNFLKCYEKLLLHNDLNTEEIGGILNAIAIFLFSGSAELQKMAYYMAIHLGTTTKDYSVLYDIASMFSYHPVTKLIKRYNEKNGKNSFYDDASCYSIVEESLSELCKRDYYQSKQQYNLVIDVLNEDNLVAIAPTSYGKSHLIIEKCLNNYNEKMKICILVPTKSLLRQTLANIIEKKGNRKGIISHPDMFTSENILQPHIAVLTQERLIASLTKWDKLRYDYIMVDECHNLFKAEERSLNLARSIMIAKNRNGILGKMDYYSPFVTDPKTSLSIVGAEEQDVNISKVDESMKIPEFFVLDDKNKLNIYDQFLDKTIDTGRIFSNYLEIIRTQGASKNIIYANRPRDVEIIADEIASEFGIISFSTESKKIIDDACKTLRSLIGDEYNIIRLLKSGVAISHGKMLDIVKDYLEKLYRELPEIHYMVTTSTLLEGINIPAEKMFILSYNRGRSNLDRPAFQNLIGRIGRFNNIFGDKNPNPSRLISEIYILKNNKYMSNDASPISFLESGAKEGKEPKDSINNPLLSKYNKADKDERLVAEITKLCNMDPCNKDQYKNLNAAEPKMATTKFGKRCFKNNVSLFNIIIYEDTISRRLEIINEKINSADKLVEIIVNCILKPTFNEENINNNRWMYSLYSNEALNAVVRNIIKDRVADDYNIAKLIVPIVLKWKSKINSFEPVYVGGMGDCTKDSSRTGRWTKYHKFSSDDQNLMFSYAVGLAKENLDKLEYYIMPLVETLNDLGYVDEIFYKRLKYGTDDDFTIGLLRLGFDISLAKLFSADKKIRHYFNIKNEILECKNKDGLLVEMCKKEYSAIFIDEVNSLL